MIFPCSNHFLYRSVIYSRTHHHPINRYGQTTMGQLVIPYLRMEAMGLLLVQYEPSWIVTTPYVWTTMGQLVIPYLCTEAMGLLLVQYEPSWIVTTPYVLYP